MLFTITPDTSHGDRWLYLSNQVPDLILVLWSPLSTFHATFIAYLSQIATYERFPSIHRHSARLSQSWCFATSFTCTAWVAARGGLQCFDSQSRWQRFYVVITRYILVHTSLFFLHIRTLPLLNLVSRLKTSIQPQGIHLTLGMY